MECERWEAECMQGHQLYLKEVKPVCLVRPSHLISLFQIASGVSNSPRNVSLNFSGPSATHTHTHTRDEKNSIANTHS